jgi:hypothetical protein
MRLLIASIFALVVLGCATQPQQQNYVYTPPVVVTLKALYRTNNYSVAVFTMKNISSEPMWYDGERRDHPPCCIQYRSVIQTEACPDMGEFWGDTGLMRYKLAPGEAGTFRVRRSQFLEPFRAGVWLSKEADNRTVNDSVYWSTLVSP